MKLITIVAFAMMLGVPASAAATGLDPSFGEGGTLVLGGVDSTVAVQSVAVDHDAKTWLAGGRWTTLAADPDIQPYLVRLDASGRVELEVDEKAIDDTFSMLTSAHIAPDGGVIVTGTLQGDSFFDHGVMRVLGDGTLDPTFGVDGIVGPLPFPEISGVPSVVITSDNILLAVNGSDFDNDGVVVVALDDAGGVDPALFDDGIFAATAPIEEFLSAGPWWVAGDELRAIVHRPDGIAAVSVSDSGLTDLALIPTNGLNTIPSVSQPFPDGSMIFGATTYGPGFVFDEFVTGRLTEQGALDPLFASPAFTPAATRAPSYIVVTRPDSVALVSQLEAGDELLGPDIVTFDRTGSNVVHAVPGVAQDLQPYDVGSTGVDGRVVALLLDATPSTVPEHQRSVIARYVTDDSGRFVDDDSSVHESDIEEIARVGLTAGCGPALYCPGDGVTRAQMASFLVRTLRLPAVDSSPFEDIVGSIHEDDIAALAAAGITRGCTPTRYCPDDTVTRGQMASFLVTGFDIDTDLGSPFTDIDVSVHRTDIERLDAAGITDGCTPTLFCPEEPVTRAQTASFLLRALAWSR
jgi:hypothetical protein